MKSPYLVVSDQHHHEWQSFSKVNEDGVNSRLQIILDELRRAANELKAAGGNRIFNAGDCFHVRGNLPPSVLNPVLDLHRELISEGFEIAILAGNHDLQGSESNRLGSAITSLEGVGCKIINDFETGAHSFENIVMVPWHKSLDQLKEKVESIYHGREDIDLFLHAPLNDVIYGIPNHGLDAGYLASLCFKRVLVGHYHNHKDFGNGVYSIGATTQQSFSDVGSKAGFLLVYPDKVVFRASHAPRFVDINETNYEDAEALSDGNYIRCRINVAKESDVAELRQQFIDYGALGVIINQVKDCVVTERGGTAIASGSLSLEASVNEFVSLKGYGEKVSKLCSEILSEAGGIE